MNTTLSKSRIIAMISLGVMIITIVCIIVIKPNSVCQLESDNGQVKKHINTSRVIKFTLLVTFTVVVVLVIFYDEFIKHEKKIQPIQVEKTFNPIGIAH